MPEGFDAWILTLAAKDPRRRFQRAADASWALSQMRDGPLREPRQPAPGPIQAGVKLSAEATTVTLPWAVKRAGPYLALSGDEELAAQRPPLPSRWQRADAVDRTVLQGAGLGLYGLRAIPLVGRQEERRLIWEALRKTREELRARVVALLGAAGCGKSRLAQWVCERAHEVGAAVVLKAFHNPIAGPGDGLRAMLMHHFRCTELSREHLVGRLKGLLRQLGLQRSSQWQSLAELLAPRTDSAGDEEARRFRFGSSTERYTFIFSVLARLAAERPLVLWLDDVQWGLDSLGFLSHLLDQQGESPLPVLVVVTAREEAMAERPTEAALLRSLLDGPGAQTLAVPPLAPHEHSSLVRALLGFEGALTAQVEARTAGNPLFAVQLVEDWVQRGILRPGEGGFRLAEGADVPLPEHIHEVWAGRIARLLDERPEQERVALELAAVLGQDVDGAEWEELCRLAGLRVPQDLVERLLVQRLAVRRDKLFGQGWSFVHGMLRESLEQLARQEGRWQGQHMLCVDMLRNRSETGISARLGRHLLHAGQLREAIRPLLDGLLECLDGGDLYASEQLFAECEGAMRSLGLPAEDSAWGEAWLLQARLVGVRGHVKEAMECTVRAETAAREHGWQRILAEALAEHAQWDWNHLRSPEQVLPLLEEAEALAQEIDDRPLLSKCRNYMGYFCCFRGGPERAGPYFEKAYEGFCSLGDHKGMGRSSFGLSSVARQTGDLEQAQVYIERAHRHYERSGYRSGIANCLNFMGEYARMQGDLDRAEMYYRRSLDLLCMLGSNQQHLSKLNLALVLVEKGQYKEARQDLEALIEPISRIGRQLLIGGAHLFLLPCLAHQRDWDAWDHHLEVARSMLIDRNYFDVDLASIFGLAGDIARQAGELTRAREVYEISTAQWQGLGDPQKAALIEARLAALDGEAASGTDT